jgi:hypothetical protein
VYLLQLPHDGQDEPEAVALVVEVVVVVLVAEEELEGRATLLASPG